MTPATTAAEPVDRLYRFTVEQYERMLAADLPVGKHGAELIRGRIVYKRRYQDGHRVPYRFSVEEYHRLIELGILREDDPVELIRGEVVIKMPHGDPHGTAVEKLDRRFQRLLPDEYAVRCQLPGVFPENAPEPDLVVCLPADQRADRHPRPEHVFILIEVADTSLREDQTIRLQLYARAGIPEYWIVNLVDRQIEVYTDPATTPDGEPHYRTRTNYVPGQHVPLAVAGAAVGAVPVDAVLPPA